MAVTSVEDKRGAVSTVTKLRIKIAAILPTVAVLVGLVAIIGGVNAKQTQTPAGWTVVPSSQGGGQLTYVDGKGRRHTIANGADGSVNFGEEVAYNPKNPSQGTPVGGTQQYAGWLIAGFGALDVVVGGWFIFNQFCTRRSSVQVDKSHSADLVSQI